MPKKTQDEATEEAGQGPTPTPPPPATPKDSGKLSVNEWAELKFPPNKKGHRPPEFAFHAGAAALHGWAEHAHHENGAMELSEVDYNKAIEAAKAPKPAATPSKDNPLPREIYVPHKAALSKHSPAVKRAADKKKAND